jgi:hypothetical protein
MGGFCDAGGVSTVSHPGSIGGDPASGISCWSFAAAVVAAFPS